MSVVCITFDKDGKEAFKEEFADGYTPRNGFEYVGNNVFHKKLGDPRCISDAEIRSALVAANKPPPLPTFRQALEQMQHEESDKSSCPIKRNENHSTRFIRAEGKTHQDAILFAQFNGCVIRSKSGKAITIHGPDMTHSCGFKELDPNFTFYKLELNLTEKTIGIWYDDSGVLPHVVITEAFE